MTIKRHYCFKALRDFSFKNPVWINKNKQIAWRKKFFIYTAQDKLLRLKSIKNHTKSKILH